MSATINLPLCRAIATEFKPVVLGGGGSTQHLSISLDGNTILMDGDVNGAWKLDTVTDRWRSLQLPILGTPYNLGTKNFGLIHNQQGPTDIRVSPSNSDVIYYFLKTANINVSINNAYLMRSGDGGDTFSRCAGYEVATATGGDPAILAGNSAPTKFYYPKIGIDPSNPDVVYVPYPGTGFKPKKSTDGGKTFNTITGLPVQVTGTIGAACFAIDPSSDIVGGEHQRVVCYMFQDGFYESLDGGSTWNKILDRTTAIFADSIQFGPSGVLFYAAQNDGVYRYTTDGAPGYLNGVWTEILNTVSNVKIAVHPTTDSRLAILVPGSGWYHSTNANTTATLNFFGASTATFTPVGPWYQKQNTGVKFVINRAICWNPAVTDQIMCCTNQGVVRSTLNNSGFGVWEIPVLGTEELVGNDILHIAGKSHINGFGWDEGGFIWQRNALDVPPEDKIDMPSMAGWSGGLFNCWQSAVDPQNTNHVVVCGSERFQTPMAASGYSDDGGLTWDDFTADPEPASASNELMQICVNNRIKLWCDAFDTAVGHPFPCRSDDDGASWTQLTAANYIGYPTTPPALTGFGYALHIQARQMAADGLDANVFYHFNTNTTNRLELAGTWKSEDAGLTWRLQTPGTGTPGSGVALSNPYYNNSLVVGVIMRAVLGMRGVLVLSPTNTSGPTWPATGFTFVYSTNGGASWVQFDTNILSVQAFGFGKAAPGATYPTIFFVGFYKGFLGLYRFDNFDISTIVCLVDPILGRFPNGLGSFAVQSVDGDKDVYGRPYWAMGQSGFCYCDSA